MVTSTTPLEIPGATGCRYSVPVRVMNTVGQPLLSLAAAHPDEGSLPSCVYLVDPGEAGMSTSAGAAIMTSYTTGGATDEGARRDRYVGVVRGAGAVIAGVGAGFLLLSSLEVGIGWALEGHYPGDWNLTEWGNHWVWRAVASVTATYLAGFLVGIIARKHGKSLAVIAALPSALFWLFIAYTAWTQEIPFGGAVKQIPLGYRIIATVLVLATLPIAATGGELGTPYGRANAEHFDSRRGALLGVRWYHFLWIPFLAHLMVLTGAFGAAYGSQWLVAAWKSGMSFFSVVPTFCYVGIVMTLVWLGTGAMKTYEALAGFEGDDKLPVWKSVMKYGFGYTVAVAIAQTAIVLAYYGVGIVLQKLFG